MKEILRQVGLTEGECQVYEALVGLGLSSTGDITKKAGIASSKVYEVLHRLQQKGLASFIIQNGVRYYDATPPERLIDFLEERKEQLDEAQGKIRKILPTLRQKHSSAAEQNQTVVYTGLQGPKIALNEILESGKRGVACCGYGTDRDPYVDFLPAALAKFTEAAKRCKFETRLIFAKGFHSPNVTAKVRYMPKAYLPPVRTMIYGNKVAIVDFTKPITTIIIENKNVADSYQKHFDKLWRLAAKN
jgi:sugar-specific transcriptional regulator TrmB